MGAHDQWLEPEVTRADGGALLRSRLVVGEAPFADEDKPFERAKLTRLELVSRNGAIDLLPEGVEGASPLVTVARLGDGEFLLAADRKVVTIELAPDKFESYLASEGLASIAAERAARGESKRPGRERYTRYTKALVQVGPLGAHGMASKTLGQKLEIVLDGGAEPLRVGAPLGVRVTFEGRPLAGAKLQASVRRPNASSPDGGSSELSATTDARGKASFTLPAAGFVVLHLVHMRRCVERDGAPCPSTEWESFWGSFTARIE